MLTPEELTRLIEESSLVDLIEQVAQDNLLESARLTRAVIDNIAKYVELEKITDPAKRAEYIRQHALPSLNWRNYVATSINQNQQQVLQSVAKLAKATPELVEEIFQEAGALSYSYDASPFKLAFEAGVIDSLPPPTLARNPQFQAILEAGYKQTLQEVEGWIRPKGRNFTGTTAIQAQQNRILQVALDQAYTQVATNTFTVEQATKNAIYYLADNNFKDRFARYNNPGKRPHKNHLDVAIRRSLLAGINQTCAVMTGEMCDKFGAPAVEMTAHIGARNDGTGYENHEDWQGRVYSYKGRAPQYPDFVITCGYGKGGGIDGWGCRHSWLAYFPGISERAYNPEDYKMEPVMYNGKQIPYYHATQELRKLERDKRNWIRKFDAAKAAGLDSGVEDGKVRALNRKIADFCKQTEIKRQPNRERPVS